MTGAQERAPSKLVALSEAVERFIPDGCSIVAGTCLEALIPFAAGREIMRQGRRDLTLIGPISDILFDQLIGAGCVRRVRAAWVGNVITGSAYRFREAVESNQIEIEDHSNLTLAMGLLAGSLGVPYMPLRTALGSDLPTTNESLRQIDDPFSDQKLMAVAAIRPDVALLHVQRADERGNAHLWGNLGVSREAVLASRDVILTAEEIVPSEVIKSDPNRVIAPGFRVKAVAHVPWGAHPAPAPGYYNRDHGVYIDYRAHSQTSSDFAAWKKRWVDEIDDQDTYLDRLGKAALDGLRIEHRAPAAEVDYGY